MVLQVVCSLLSEIYERPGRHKNVPALHHWAGHFQGSHMPLSAATVSNGNHYKATRSPLGPDRSAQPFAGLSLRPSCTHVMRTLSELQPNRQRQSAVIRDSRRTQNSVSIDYDN